MATVEFLAPRIGREWKTAGVGHFRDAAAFERFSILYREAMALLPEPNEQRATVTSFGQVRVYRFGDGPGTPLLLLPGRTSCTPVWGANLPGLMRTERSIPSMSWVRRAAAHKTRRSVRPVTR